jgi:hypothetical protein
MSKIGMISAVLAASAMAAPHEEAPPPDVPAPKPKRARKRSGEKEQVRPRQFARRNPNAQRFSKARADRSEKFVATLIARAEAKRARRRARNLWFAQLRDLK